MRMVWVELTKTDDTIVRLNLAHAVRIDPVFDDDHEVVGSHIDFTHPDLFQRVIEFPDAIAKMIRHAGHVIESE